jgi:dTDP-4-amino-4,6-dideoxygalactose transaminase
MHADEIHQTIRQVVDGGWYLRGEATAQFAQQYARYIGTKYCISVGNGLDALTLILRAYKEIGVLKEGDEVIVPANTYIATILAITENRLVPVLVEPDIDTLQIDESRIGQAVTSRTRAVMLVHLYGRCSYTETIGALCRQHDLLLLEDNAQAHGCCFKGRRTGSLGMAAGHSFYPGKNLGALGDAGAVTTSDDRLAEVVRSMANYGSSRKYVFDYQGCNSRLDEIQAAVLSVKLKYLDDDNARRQAIADYYIKHVKNPLLRLPEPSGSVFHVFPVLCEQRDRLQQYLAENGVATVVHYPIPPHKQACYEKWHDICLPITEQIHAQELSIPCHQAMTSGEVETVTDIINRFTN